MSDPRIIENLKRINLLRKMALINCDHHIISEIDLLCSKNKKYSSEQVINKISKENEFSIENSLKKLKEEFPLLYENVRNNILKNVETTNSELFIDDENFETLSIISGETTSDVEKSENSEADSDGFSDSNYDQKVYSDDDSEFSD